MLPYCTQTQRIGISMLYRSPVSAIYEQHGESNWEAERLQSSWAGLLPNTQTDTSLEIRLSFCPSERDRSWFMGQSMISCRFLNQNGSSSEPNNSGTSLTWSNSMGPVTSSRLIQNQMHGPV
jgi:hypothetical protein